MDDPISPARRTLLKAGAATLATPVAAAIAQPAGHQEAKSFDLWVISDQHVGTDKAASEGIQHGLVGFRPPPVRAESLATALRQSEEGGAFGGPSFNSSLPDRRHLGALHLQGRQYPLPNDGRPQ